LDHSFRLDNNAFKKGNIILEGPPRRLSGLEIPDMLDNLVLKKMGMSLYDIKMSITGLTNVYYGNSCMPEC
jgi:hypothetical protein